MLTFLFAAILAPSPSTAPSEAVIERFITTPHVASKTKAAEQATTAVKQAASTAATRHDAVTAGLKLLYPDFDAALKKLAAEDARQAAEMLKPLTESKDPFLAAEAQLFLARALMVQERFEDALPVLNDLIKSHAGDTVRAGEAWFLKGKLEAGALQRADAAESLKTFLDQFPGEPSRMVGEARATLIDLEESQSDLLSDIHTKMNFSGRRLALEDSSKRTQEVQDEVVALLDEMIEELEKKSGNCKGCKGSCSKPGGGGQGGAAPGMSSGSSQSTQITERDAPRTPWVDLSQRQNDPSVFNAAKTRVPVQYRGLVEQYYQSFGDSREK